MRRTALGVASEMAVGFSAMAADLGIYREIQSYRHESHIREYQDRFRDGW